MSDDFYPPNFRDPPKKPPAQVEQEIGGYAVMLFRALGVPMPLEGDVRAVHRTGELLRRWWRNLVRKT